MDTTENPYPSRAELRDVTIVPPDVHLAAKRGFVRTTVQAFAASIPTAGVSAGAMISLVTDPDPVVLGCTAAAALLTPLLAGLASYLSILGSGIPADYQATIESA